jgi:hypothetical protein
VFHVSCGSGTCLTSKEKSDPWNAIGARMLAQLLNKDVETISRQYVASPPTVFSLVAAAENVDLYDDFTGILVVDGIQALWRNDDGKNRNSDLSSMPRRSSETEEGKLRQTPFIMICVTATHSDPANQFLAASNRKRVYLPLNRLDAPTWKNDNSPVLRDDPGTRLLVKDVGGHARAIEAIADKLTEYQNGFQPNIAELADAIHFKLRDRYRDAISVMTGHTFPIVQCILSRQLIRLQDLIPGSDWRWEYVTAAGLLWFERTTTDYDYDYNAPGYLVAPYIWFWMLARLTPSEDTDRLYRFLREWEFNDYKELLRLQTGKGPSGMMTWQNFETFCCYFRILRSLGFGDGQEVSLKSLHSGCKKLRDDKNTMVMNLHLGYAEAVHQQSTMAASANKHVDTKHSGTLDTDNQLSYVILNAPSAPAGDFFLSIKTSVRVQTSPKRKRVQSQIIREVGQCELIQTKVTKDTYNEERNKSAGSDDFFILYTPTKISDDFALPDRSGLVDKSCWDSYFGPFAGRAYIVWQYGGSQSKEL